MSAIRLWYLYCDDADCPRLDGGQQPFSIDPHPSDTPTTQRNKAFADGWVIVGRKDYCPACAPKYVGEGSDGRS